MTAAQVVAVLAGLAAVWLSGAAVGALAGLREGRLRDVALDLALGTILIGFVGSLALVAGVRVTLAGALVLLGAPVLLALVRHRLRLHMGIALPAGRAARMLLLLAAVVLGLVVSAGLHDRLTWDAWAFWTLKARMLFHDGALPADLFAAAGPYAYAHADYPPGLSLLQWWLMAVAGEPAHELAGFAGGLLLVPLVLLFWDSARERGRAELAALGTLALAAWWPLVRHAYGQADTSIALALLGVTVHLLDADKDDAALWRAVAFAAFAALLKNEGIALAALLAVAGSAWLLRTRRLTPGRIGALLLPLALVLPWAAWVRAQGLEAEHLSGSIVAGELPARLGQVIAALARLAVHRSWIPIGPIALAAVILVLRSPARVLRLPLLLLGLYALVLVGIYLVAPLDAAFLLETSAERVFGALVPALALLALAAAAAPAPDGDNAGSGASFRFLTLL